MNEVWQVLMATSLAPHEDLLVTTAVKFLTTVGTSVHHALFAQPGILQNVCEKIISPNIQLIQADEDLFDENAFEHPARHRGLRLRHAAARLVRPRARSAATTSSR